MIATVICVGITVVPVTNINAMEDVRSFNEVGSIEKVEGNFKYVVNGESITITGYTGYGKSCDVPESIEGKKVTKIGDYAFRWHGEMWDINLPSTLEEIGNNSFECCTSLQKIILPDSIKSIGDFTFLYCSSMKEIQIPKKLKSIGNSAFKDCTSVKEFIIPDTVSHMGSSVFYNCYSMSKVVLPKNTKEITNEMFAFCKSLRNIEIPEGVKTIGDRAFYACDSLIEIEIPVTVQSTGVDAFLNNTSLEKVIIYNKDMLISDKSMSGTTELTIYGYKDSTAESFANKYNFKFVPLEGEPKSKDPIPKDDVRYDSIFKYEEFNYAVRICGVKEGNKELDIPEFINGKVVNTIKTAVFMNNSEITKVILPDNMRMVGSSSFRNCTNLMSIVIPEYVEYIGKDAFKDSNNLVMYGYEDSYAAKYAKENNIKFVSLGKCTNKFLTEKYSDSVKITGVEGEYYNMEIPKKIKGKNVTTIGTYAFKGNKTLSTVEVPDTITTIGSFSFQDCVSLKKVEIPESVTYIGENAFKDCNFLVIYCKEGSYAETYAKENNIKFVLE